MAPQVQATIVLSSSPAPSSPAPADASHQPFIPVALLIFLGLCLAYTFSYVLYKIVMARRRESEDGIPDSPDRGVSQFMNGARLTLNFGNNHKPSSLSESPEILDEEKPLTDPSHTTHTDVPASSPADSSSTPFTILMPSFTMHPNQELGQVKLKLAEDEDEDEQTSTKARDSVPDPNLLGPDRAHAPALGPTAPTTQQLPQQPPAPPPPQQQQPFSQRVAAKVKILSRDRAEAIALDPKLAPVQGPLRPLSMVSSPQQRKRTTLFGLGFKHGRAHGGGGNGDPETDSEAK